MQNYADSGMPADRDISGKSEGLLDQSEYSVFDVTLPAGYAEKDKDADARTIQNDADRDKSNMDQGSKGGSEAKGLDQNEASPFDVTFPATD